MNFDFLEKSREIARIFVVDFFLRLACNIFVTKIVHFVRYFKVTEVLMSLYFIDLTTSCFIVNKDVRYLTYKNRRRLFKSTYFFKKNRRP